MSRVRLKDEERDGRRIVLLWPAARATAHSGNADFFRVKADSGLQSADFDDGDSARGPLPENRPGALAISFWEFRGGGRLARPAP